MGKDILSASLEKFLDDWDPIGILEVGKPIQYGEKASGEYSKYIKPLIVQYVQKESIFDFLIKLQCELWIHPTAEMKVEIKNVADRIIKELSNYTMGELKEFTN